MEDQLREIENTDGLRCVFNIFPTQQSDILPNTIMYTPQQPLKTILDYEPIFCVSCRSIMNPYCEINFDSKTWTCVFCKKICHLPDYYRDITQDSLPLELYDTTVEYTLTKEVHPPLYVLLVDTCTFDDERHLLLREAVNETLSLMEKDALVCIIHFGTNIELIANKSNSKKIFLFTGKKAYTTEMLRTIFSKTNSKNTSAFKQHFRHINDLFYDPMEIRRDPFPVARGMRQSRCTGAALSFAASIVDMQDTGAKIFLFTQGPCTYGPGSVCNITLTEKIRSHDDIINNNASNTESANHYYTELAKRIASQGHCVDIIAATIEDIGLYEMKPLTDMTGGIIIMAQDFDRTIYLSSIKKNLENNSALNAKIKIHTSANIKFKTVLGLGTQLASGWRINSLYHNTNLGIIIEPNSAKPEELGYLQFVTQTQRGRKLHVRVTTLTRTFSDSKEKISLGFDQEAACVLQARMFTFTNKFEEDRDLVRRIDRSLIRFVKKYASFAKEDSSSVILPDTMQFYPQFMYFLRRSVVVQSEANSPDETSYYRNILCRERTTEAMTIVVPVLTNYHYVDGVYPVDMDSKSLMPDSVLLLDAFVNVLIWKGEHITEWIKEGYHEKEDYVSLKKCLEACKTDARKLVEERLPHPKFTETYSGGSQERILKSRVNPSKNGANIVTEDIDFESFFRCLCKIVVEN